MASFAGIAIVALSLFVLKWADNDKGSFLDISSLLRNAGSDAVDDNGVYIYGAWAGFALLAVTAVLVFAATVLVSSRGSGERTVRIACATGMGLAAVLHALAVAHLFRGSASPEPGAWLGIVGYFVAILGPILGAGRRPAAPVPIF